MNKKPKDSVDSKAIKTKKKDYVRRAQTKMIEAPDANDTQRYLTESVSILTQKVRKQIRQSNTKLPEELRQLRDIVKIWKDVQEVQIKYLMLEKDNGATSFDKIYQNILNITPEQLKGALTKEPVEAVVEDGYESNS